MDEYKDIAQEINSKHHGIIIDYDFSYCNMDDINDIYKEIFGDVPEDLNHSKICYKVCNYLLQNELENPDLEIMMNSLFPVITKVVIHFPNLKAFNDYTKGGVAND